FSKLYRLYYNRWRVGEANPVGRPGRGVLVRVERGGRANNACTNAASDPGRIAGTPAKQPKSSSLRVFARCCTDRLPRRSAQPPGEQGERRVAAVQQEAGGACKYQRKYKRKYKRRNGIAFRWLWMGSAGLLGITHENRACGNAVQRNRNKPEQRKYQGQEQAINKREQDPWELSAGSRAEG